MRFVRGTGGAAYTTYMPDGVIVGLRVYGFWYRAVCKSAPVVPLAPPSSTAGWSINIRHNSKAKYKATLIPNKALEFHSLSTLRSKKITPLLSPHLGYTTSSDGQVMMRLIKVTTTNRFITGVRLSHRWSIPHQEKSVLDTTKNITIGGVVYTVIYGSPPQVYCK